MLDGLLALKKFGLASFCNPAKEKVNPRKARRGRRAHPESANDRGGGASSVFAVGGAHQVHPVHPPVRVRGSGSMGRAESVVP